MGKNHNNTTNNNSSIKNINKNINNNNNVKNIKNNECTGSNGVQNYRKDRLKVDENEEENLRRRMELRDERRKLREESGVENKNINDAKTKLLQIEQKRIGKVEKKI